LNNSKVYRWTIDDNIYLTKAYRDEVKRAHSGGMYERFVKGKFAPVALGSFEFDYTVHVLGHVEPERIKHVVYGVDFGWTNPSAIICVGFDGDGRAYVLDEFYQNRVHVETLAEEAKEMIVAYGEGPFLCDRSEPRTIREMQLANVQARADDGKRDEGIREIGGRLKIQEDKKPRLYVKSNCVNLISELQIFDQAKKENDHAVDALRYALCGEGGGEIQVLTGKVKYR